MIRIKDFTIGYDRRILVREASGCLEDGKLTAMIGRNGAGKSTILRALAGLNGKYTGDIEIDGKISSTLSHRQRAELIAFVNTERIRISNLRCKDIVAMGRAPYTDWIGKMTEQDSQIVKDAIHQTGMTEFAERTPDTMSDGECQRVMIARALAQDTRNLLLDEPTSFLDVPSRYELVGLLRRLAHDNGKCVLYSTHEVELAIEMSDRVMIVDDSGVKIYDARELDAREVISSLRRRNCEGDNNRGI